jgi:protein involved in polysaccharide export with SLBB domain
MKFVFSSPLLGWARGGVALACLLFFAGCASDGASSGHPPMAGSGGGGPSENPDAMRTDALRVGELLVIEYSGVSDPPPHHEERIKLNGKITLPSLGEVDAAGITRGELEQKIHDLYVPNYYRQLTVIVRNEGRFFYVGGQVKNPSQYPYLKEMTVLKAIATAGDFTDFAKKTKVLVTRADGRKIIVNCIKAQRDPRLDISIYPDDTIYVPRRYF